MNQGIPKSPSLNAQLANAVAAIACAQDTLVQMAERTRHAQQAESDARSKVNELQKHFDALVAEVRKSAPLGSSWNATGLRDIGIGPANRD